MNQIVAVAVGGAIGSVMRYGLSTWVHTLAGRAFPYGTLAVNVLGCSVMGLLFVLLVERTGGSPAWRAGLLIGVLGGFTTFSSFSIETFNLIEQGDWLKAMANIVLSLVLCIAGTWLGVILARQL